MRLLRILHRLLLGLARKISRLNTSILMAISYFGILWPLALALRAFRREKTAAGWNPRPALESRHFEKQY